MDTEANLGSVGIYTRRLFLACDVGKVHVCLAVIRSSIRCSFNSRLLSASSPSRWRGGRKTATRGMLDVSQFCIKALGHLAHGRPGRAFLDEMGQLTFRGVWGVTTMCHDVTDYWGVSDKTSQLRMSSFCMFWWGQNFPCPPPGVASVRAVRWG